MRTRILVSLAVVLFAFSLSAQTNHISVFVSDTSFKSTTETDPDVGRVKLSFHSKSGYGVGFDHFQVPQRVDEIVIYHANCCGLGSRSRVRRDNPVTLSLCLRGPF